MALWLADAANAQTSVETFVMNVAGVVNAVVPGCTASGPPAPVAAIFGGNGNFEPSAGIAPCGLGGGTRSLTQSAGPLTDSASLPLWNWPTSNGYIGNVVATADYGFLGALSQSTLVGFGNYSGSEGMSVFRDRLTVTSPPVTNGSSGSLVFRSTISGSLTANGPGTSDVEVWYLVNGINSIQFRAQATSPLAPPFVVAPHDVVDGFVLANGSLSGSDEIKSGSIPFVFGTAFDFRLALLAYTTPGNTSTNDSHFAVELTGIEIRNAANQVVGSFQITAESGTEYGPNGIYFAPVPALPLTGLVLLAGALATLGAARVRSGL